MSKQSESKLKPVEFDFLERVLVPGTKSDLKYEPNDEDRPCDVIEHIDEVRISNDELQPISGEYHKVFMSQTEVPLEESWSSEESLQIIYDEFRGYLEAQAETEDEKIAYIKALDERVWPELKPILANNKNTAAWAKRFVTCSLFAADFILNIAKGDLALAMPVAHGVLPDIMGKFRPIPPNDGAFAAILEESLQWAALRSSYFQTVLADVWDDMDEDENHRILFPGGGCDAVLWTRGFYIAENEAVVIYDKKDYGAALEQLLNSTLEENNIEYRVADFTEAFNDPEQIESYDEIVISGLMPYIWKNAKGALAEFKKLLKPDGRILFDLSVECLSYLFVGTTFPWPAKEMYLPKTFEQAIDDVEAICEATGLEINEVYYEDDYSDDEDHENRCKAGIAFTIMNKAD